MIGNTHCEYIEGKRFSSNYRFDLCFGREYLSRDEAIMDEVKDKKIIHVGFAGHFENIEKSMRKGKWFHKKLYDKAALCVGMDINEKAVNHISEHYDYDHIFCDDILEQTRISVIEENDFDYIVLGEVLEHIDNPVDFIARLQKKYEGRVKGLIVTVPNAFRKRNFYNSFRSVEKINSDHRYWFTPYTIAKVLRQGECTVDTIHMCSGRDRSQLDFKGKLERYFSLESRFPSLREIIVVFARLDQKNPM